MRSVAIVVSGLALAALAAGADAHLGRSHGIADGYAGIVKLSGITAEFVPSEKSTHYTAIIYKSAAPDSKQVKWTLKPPDDNKTCNNFKPDPLVRPYEGIDEWQVTAIWYHSDADGCEHKNGTQHSGTITLEVANPKPRQLCTAKYVGTVNGTQDAGVCERGCAYYEGAVRNEFVLQNFLRGEITDAKKVIDEAKKRYEDALKKVPEANLFNLAEHNKAVGEANVAVGALNEARAALERLQAKLDASRKRVDELNAFQDKECGKYFRLLSHRTQGTRLCEPESLAAGSAAGKAQAFAAFTSAFKRVPLAAGARAGQQATAALGRLAAKAASRRGGAGLARRYRSAQDLMGGGNAATARLQRLVRLSATKARSASRERETTQGALDTCLAAGFGP